MREAPSIYIINELLKQNAAIKAFDPAAIENSKFYFNDKITYANNIYDAAKDCDALLILAEWNEFRNPDFPKLSTQLKNKVIFDGRNLFDIEQMKNQGFDYISIGRKPVLNGSKVSV